ncbi:hypothetical protein GQF03_17485 [Sneathiella chungangensis]|uniref:DUF2399 domain-containing protein n=1 Tax=Sneathiella chungangensis TaxID=1418234 RepID=A0A845MLT6_9PROT|nr:hypothetical protein [Sneathiella chungangensis]MZR24130.1 hypothetical protein [Sneathiella chungangensis]
MRARGFIDSYRPKGERLALIEAVNSILADNEDILPLTIRQIFYMLVTSGFQKDERAYKRLTEAIGQARRARMIDMDAIRDDGFHVEQANGWLNSGMLLDSFRRTAASFRLDRQTGQSTRLMLWCEAKGMVPQLASAVNDYGVNVYSSGGFDSLTAKHDMARTIAQYDFVEILHIGDHDPSGVHVANSLYEDLAAFSKHYRGRPSLTRIAVTPAQIESMGLPTAPPKKTDRISFDGPDNTGRGNTAKAVKRDCDRCRHFEDGRRHI